MPRLWSSLVACAWLTVAARAQGVGQHRGLGEGTFGYVNASGSEIIALDSVRNPRALHAAVCAAAHVYPVVYARRQIRRPEDSGRQVAANFANAGGDVFRLGAAGAHADETCYLSADSSLVARATPVTAPSGPGCDSTRLRHASEAKHRPVLYCWTLGSAGRNVEVLALQFTVIDTSALASVMVADHDRLLFRDLPATYRGPGTDVWRVEDGGVFSPEAFAALFVGRVDVGYVMALTWAGAEGEDAYLLLADSGQVFRVVTQSYRYWVPE